MGELRRNTSGTCSRKASRKCNCEAIVKMALKDDSVGATFQSSTFPVSEIDRKLRGSEVESRLAIALSGSWYWTVCHRRPNRDDEDVDGIAGMTRNVIGT